MNPDERVLMDAAAIPRVVEMYADMILRIAYQALQCRADAEDVVQDVFLRLLDKNEFESFEHLKAWLIRVTVNRCKDIQKSAWKRKNVELSEDWPAADEQQRETLEELAQLKPDDRMVIYLYYFERYTIAEIAQMLGKNINTVNSRLARARGKLRDILLEGGYEHA